MSLVPAVCVTLALLLLSTVVHASGSGSADDSDGSLNLHRKHDRPRHSDGGSDDRGPHRGGNDQPERPPPLVGSMGDAASMNSHNNNDHVHHTSGDGKTSGRRGRGNKEGHDEGHNPSTIFIVGGAVVALFSIAACVGCCFHKRSARKVTMKEAENQPDRELEDGVAETAIPVSNCVGPATMLALPATGNDVPIGVVVTPAITPRACKVC